MTHPRLTPRRVAVGLGAVALAVVGVLAVSIQPLASDMCVQVYEDASQQGDTMSVCNTPANLKVPNLNTYTTGLHGGCNRSVNQSSTWNDCISSGRIAALPAAQAVKFYQDTSYGALVACFDQNGSYAIDLSGAPNDLISSFRVVGGNC